MYQLLGHPLSPLAKGGGNREKDRRGKCVFRDVRFTKGGRGFEVAKNEVDRGGKGLTGWVGHFLDDKSGCSRHLREIMRTR